MSEQRPVWSTEVRRFLSNYRWELWLLVGIPVIGVVQLEIAILLELDQSDPYLRGFYLPYIASLSTRLLLLAGFYLPVRGLGREFLTLLWGYLIFSTALALGQTAAYYYSVDDYFVYVTQSNLHLSLLDLAIRPLLDFLVLLWFARQASRISLWHAFFLVAVTDVTAGSIGLRPLGIGIYIVPSLSLLPTATGYLFLLLKVWLLGNFDGWGPKQRRNAIFALVAVSIAFAYLITAPIESGVIWPRDYSFIPRFMDTVTWVYEATYPIVYGLATLLATLAIVYLVRVRRRRPWRRRRGSGRSRLPIRS